MRYLEAGAGWPVSSSTLSLERGHVAAAARALPEGWRLIAPDVPLWSRAGAVGRIETFTLTMWPGTWTPARPSRNRARRDRWAVDGGYVTLALFRQSPERFSGMSSLTRGRRRHPRRDARRGAR